MRMNFTYAKTKNWYLKDTAIENIFIGEYMAPAKGDYVKVYLLAQMYAANGASEEPRIFANQLLLSQETVDEAWEYWEKCGLVERIFKGEKEDGYDIRFLSPREALYCGKDAKNTSKAGDAEKKNATGTKKSSVADRLVDTELKDLFAAIQEILGRPITPMECETVGNWRSDYAASSEMILYAYSYCVNILGKESIRYIDAVVRAWAGKGLTDTEKIEKYLDEVENRHSLHRRIFKALGFMRNPTEAEEGIMDSWFNDGGFSLEEILDACTATSGISNPNIKYVDKVLEGRRKEGKAGKPTPADEVAVSRKVVIEYYEYLRQKASDEAKARRAEVYAKVPKIGELQNELKEIVPQISKALIRKNKEESSRLRERCDAILEESNKLLKKAGFSEDYLEDRYYCDECKDTGFRETGEKCSCYEKRMSEAKQWQKSLAN